MKFNLCIFSFWVALLMPTLLLSNQVSASVDTLHVYDNMHIQADEVLLIEAGTTVYFHGYYYIIVEGTVEAIGTEAEPIVFTRSDTLGLYQTDIQEGGWNGIRFKNHANIDTTQVSVFENCVFENAKASLLDFESGGAMSILGLHKVEIRNSIFRNNYCYRKGGALYLEGNHALLEQNYFYNNTAYNEEQDNPPLHADGGALFMYASRAEVSWSDFQHNTASGIGGAIVIEESAPLIYNNRIENNYAEMGGGISLRRSHFYTPMSNNLIANNSSMFFGGGMFFLDSHAQILNHTIADNYSMYGGGIFFITFNDLTDPYFYNCIIRNNSIYPGQPNQVFIWDALSAPNFMYCNIEGAWEGFEGGGDSETMIYENNMDEDVAFVAEGDHPYALLPESPSVDAGDVSVQDMGIPNYDLAGHARFSGMEIDMGAYEFQDPHFWVYTSVEGEGSIEPGEQEYFVPMGSNLVFEAIPDDGWAFLHWDTSMGILESNPLQIEVLENCEMKAVFQPLSFLEEYTPVILQDYFYPNPVQNHLFVKSDYQIFGDRLHISIYSSSGVLQQNFVFETRSHNQIRLMDLSSLSDGLYLVNVRSVKYNGSFKILKVK